MTRALEITDLSVTISSARIIQGLSLRVEPGEIVGLAGRNGAGKTTTLRAISGMIGRTAGTVAVGGKKLPSRPDAVARAGIAHVPEGRGIFADLTVDENIQLGLIRQARHAPTLRKALEEVFPAVVRLRHQKAGKLSGGEQQMVALFRGLVSKPEFILVDEMSLGLSPRALRTAIETLAMLGHDHGIGVLVVDQNSRMLHEHCDKVYLLTDGHLELWTDASNIESAYFE